jgi:hypothetical protein
MRKLLEKIEQYTEASYSGNLGAVEMLKFYRIATPSEIKAMERFLDIGNYKDAWELLQKVTNTRLGNMKGKWNPKRYI